MSAIPARLQMLDKLADEMKEHSRIYLAALLVAEAYQNECLRNTVFNGGTADDAAIKVSQRLRGPDPVPIAPPPAPPQRRKNRKSALATAIAARGLDLGRGLNVEAP